MKWSLVYMFIAFCVGAIVYACLNDEVVEPFVEITEDSELPFWAFQGLCDSTDGVYAITPTFVAVEPTAGYIYNATSGEVEAEWFGTGLGPFEVLADLLGGEACEESTQVADTLVIQGFVDVDTFPSDTYINMVEIEGHPVPFGLILTPQE